MGGGGVPRRGYMWKGKKNGNCARYGKGKKVEVFTGSD